MNKKFVLTLLSTPVLFASMLSMVVVTHPASANQTVKPSESKLSCVRNPHSPSPRLVCTRISKANTVTPKVEVNKTQNTNPVDGTELEFTEEESDTAIALFGCDCPSCLNAIRQMRGLPPISV